MTHHLPGRVGSRISPRAAARASRSAATTGSPITATAPGGPVAATTSPVQTPERARRPKGSARPAPQLRRGA